MKNREFLQIKHELHKISKAIVEEAKRTNAVIVVGKLKGIRKRESMAITAVDKL